MFDYWADHAVHLFLHGIVIYYDDLKKVFYTMPKPKFLN